MRFSLKWGFCEGKTCDFRLNVGFLKRKLVFFCVKWGILEEKTRDFHLNGGFPKRKRVIFKLNGGFSKRKCVIFVVSVQETFMKVTPVCTLIIC